MNISVLGFSVCNLNHLAGTRIGDKCTTNQTYFSLIDECVDVIYAAMPAFLEALLVGHVCPGRVVRTLDDLEALRTCDTINGSLTIAVNDANADFTALYDIEVIEGFVKCFSKAVLFVTWLFVQDRSSSWEAA